MEKLGKKVLGRLGVAIALASVLVVVSCGDSDDGGAQPEASFTATIDGLAVTVDNTSTDAASYSWDFGDGSAALTIEEGTYTYAEAGTYVITLTATNDSGSDTATETVTVEGPCDGVQSLEPNLFFGWGDENAQFDGAVFDGFGDYTTARVANPDQTGNESCFVGQITRGGNCQTWAGVGGGLAGRVDFATHGTTITLDVWSPATAGATVRLVFEKDAYPDTQPSVAVETVTTSSQAWETLTFDFSGDAASGNTYGNLILYTDPPASLGDCNSEVWYIDNLTQSSGN